MNRVSVAAGVLSCVMAAGPVFAQAKPDPVKPAPAKPAAEHF